MSNSFLSTVDSTRLSYRVRARRGSCQMVASRSSRTRLDCGLFLAFRWRRVPTITDPTVVFSPSGIECFGAHLGDPQSANLGDGNGYVNQTFELRQDYGNPDIGTCWESLVGGNHLRLFRQNGPSANTGALFLAYVCSLFASATAEN